MGYYSEHYLSLEISESSDISESKIFNDLFGECPEAACALKENGDTKGEAKWYEAIDDMIGFSENKYPDVLFKLVVFGQDKSDRCRFYFKDGQFYKTNKSELWYPHWSDNDGSFTSYKVDYTDSIRKKGLINKGMVFSKTSKSKIILNGLDEKTIDTATIIESLLRDYPDCMKFISEKSGDYEVSTKKWWKSYEATLSEFSWKYPDIIFNLLVAEKKEMIYFKNGEISYASPLLIFPALKDKRFI